MRNILGLLGLVIIVVAVFMTQRKLRPDTPVRPVTLYLHWEPQAQFLGYYVALEKGFFKKHGLDVTLKYDLGLGNALQRITTGDSTYGTNQFTNVVVWLSRGQKINLTGVVHGGCNMGWIHNKESKLLDLLKEGNVFSWWGHDDVLLRTLLAKSDGQPVEYSAIETRYPKVVGSDQVVLAMAYNQIQDYDQNKNVLDTYCDLNLGIFEDVVIGPEPKTEAVVAQNRDFMIAVHEGWKWTREHPDLALDILMKKEPRKPLEHQETQLAVFIRNIVPSAGGAKPEEVVQTIGHMMNSGAIEPSPELLELQCILGNSNLDLLTWSVNKAPASCNQ